MISKFLGPRYAQLVRHWTPAAVTWGAVAMVGVTWMTDWKEVLRFVPWIRGKFKED